MNEALPSQRSRTASNWHYLTTAAVLSSFFVTAGAPTPLLPIYQAHWGFAPWALTVVFGVYALGLLAALLVTGALSDHLGRRPVLIGSVILELLAMVAFALAPNLGALITARIIQGVATGSATGAFSAAIVELTPTQHKRVGVLLASISSPIGFAIGALLSGIIAQLSGDPILLTWLIFIVIMVFAVGLVLATPESATRNPGALASLVPRVHVPARARNVFSALLPGFIGAWMMAGLFMGLAPTIIAAVFDIHSPLVDGLIAFLQPAAAALSGAFATRWTARRVSLVGSLTVALGAALVIAAILTGTFLLLGAAGIIGGIGYGATLSGTFRELTQRARQHERSGLFAAAYIVGYLAFGLPAIIAGALIHPFGLTLVGIAFGAVTALAAAIGLAAQLRTQA